MNLKEDLEYLAKRCDWCGKETNILRYNDQATIENYIRFNNPFFAALFIAWVRGESRSREEARVLARHPDIGALAVQAYADWLGLGEPESKKVKNK